MADFVAYIGLQTSRYGRFTAPAYKNSTGNTTLVDWTFDYADILVLPPTWEASKRVTPPYVSVKLGDGYIQIIFNGLEEKEEWQITSPIFNEVDIASKVARLNEFVVGGFLWSPDNGLTVPRKRYTADAWTIRTVGIGVYQLTTTFLKLS